MDFFKKRKAKKQKKNASRAKFEKLLVNGEQVPVFNFYMFTDKDDKKPYIELASQDVVEQLHYENVDITLVLPEKKLEINADFVDAFPKGKFKVYKFLIKTFNEYYI